MVYSGIFEIHFDNSVPMKTKKDIKNKTYVQITEWNSDNFYNYIDEIHVWDLVVYTVDTFRTRPDPWNCLHNPGRFGYLDKNRVSVLFTGYQVGYPGTRVFPPGPRFFLGSVTVHCKNGDSIFVSVQIPSSLI